MLQKAPKARFGYISKRQRGILDDRLEPYDEIQKRCVCSRKLINITKETSLRSSFFSSNNSDNNISSDSISRKSIHLLY
jgi:hypothetical protein